MKRSSIQYAYLMAAATFLIVPGHYTNAELGDSPCEGVYSVEVSENDLYARVWLKRDGDTDQVQTVDYFTFDPGVIDTKIGAARAGVDYSALQGNSTFAVGQRTTHVDVPLIDNAAVDGPRRFGLILSNAPPGVKLDPPGGWVSINHNVCWVRINDNELRATVDPLFVPDVGPGQYNPVAMPDGGILVSLGPKGLTKLQPNGRVDMSFNPSLTNGFFTPLQVLDDGRIFAWYYKQGGVVRLRPDGVLDRLYKVPNVRRFVTAQRDGKVLLARGDGREWIVRLEEDGSLDRAFAPMVLSYGSSHLHFAIQSDGKILVAGSLGEGRPAIIRLNSNGSPDPTFSAGVTGYIGGLLLRRDGTLIVTGDLTTQDGIEARMVQLRADGALDQVFLWEGYSPMMELDPPERGILAGTSSACADYRLVRWRQDGSLDTGFAPDLRRHAPESRRQSYPLTLLRGGQVYLAATPINNVDGFPRPGLARLLTDPPERDFRVLTPAEFPRSSGVARIQVLRTGPTDQAASVSFSTRDDTAKAGEDYVPQSGVLHFAPLQVSQEVTVPLLAGEGVGQRLWFNLDLNNPSEGYTNIASTPVAIMPELRIAPGSLRVRPDNSVSLELQGTVEGLIYYLQVSSDLSNWSWTEWRQATGPSLIFSSIQRLNQSKPQFFRARRE